MAQKLIVEGKDAIVLTNILMKRKLAPPKGYRNSIKYKTEFVEEAGSESLINVALRATLEQPSITNIGVIIDANQVGANSRFKRTIELVKEVLKINSLDDNLNLQPTGFSWQIDPDLRLGIWIMPDNQDNGYLEHFLTELIPATDDTFQFAKEKIAELMQEDFCNFTSIKKQKALLHTYLAWQKAPGLPMGTAVQSNYLEASSNAADNFENWFKAVFELEGQ